MVKKRAPDPKEALAEYQRKRDFSKTAEPSGAAGSDGAGANPQPIFVVQKHDATNLHYDLRLEMGGVLKSWAVPKGPSLDPADRRLAVHVEDHPLEYGGFEGTIPEGEYGAGAVMLWDFGWWEPDLAWMKEARGKGRKGAAKAKPGAKKAAQADETDDDAIAIIVDPLEELAAGELKFILHGRKLSGSWALVQMKGRGEKNWLLLKHRDEEARPGSNILEEAPDSVLSGRSLDEIADGARPERGSR